MVDDLSEMEVSELLGGPSLFVGQLFVKDIPRIMPDTEHLLINKFTDTGSLQHTRVEI